MLSMRTKPIIEYIQNENIANAHVQYIQNENFLVAHIAYRQGAGNAGWKQEKMLPGRGKCSMDSFVEREKHSANVTKSFQLVS